MSEAVTEDNSLTRQLWHIAGSGDLEQLDELLSKGVNVNASDKTGVTALMRAAYHGKLRMVRNLIWYGADPNAKDRSGLTALMMAEHAGHDEIVEALRSVGARGKTENAGMPRLVGSVTEENVDAVTEENVDVATEDDVLVAAEDEVGLVMDYEHNVAPDYQFEVASDYEDSTSGKTFETARTLHEPPEIWEMVQTAESKSYTPSSGARRVFSLRTLVLAVCALIICSGVVFGFLALRGAMSAPGEAPPQQQATAVKQTQLSDQRLSATKSLSKTPDKTAQSSDELTRLKPVEKKSSALERPKATKVSAAVLKPNKNVRKTTKLESEQDASAKTAKKEPASPASDPVQPAAKQKPKVIPWP